MPRINIAELLKAREFDPRQEPPREEVVFRIDFQTIGSLGDYALLTGRPKAGKTKYLSGAIASALSREEIFGMHIKLPDGKRRVVHFDTEQGRRSHFNVLSLARQLMNADELPDYFKSYHCRQDGPAQIIAMVDYYLTQYPDTGLVFLDGLLDCIESFNDEKHSKALVNWLKKITEANNVLLIGVLHRSLSADKSIGHLGSSADRAAQSVLIVEKNKETRQYLLKAEYLRDADDFKPIAIYYNKQMSIWEQTDYIEEAETPIRGGKSKARPGELDISEHQRNCREIFNRQIVQPYEMLIDNIVQVYATGKPWAKEAVQHLIREKVIFYSDEGYTMERQAKLFVHTAK